jgi:hypothetical protein
MQNNRSIYESHSPASLLTCSGPLPHRRETPWPAMPRVNLAAAAALLLLLPGSLAGIITTEEMYRTKPSGAVLLGRTGANPRSQLGCCSGASRSPAALPQPLPPQPHILARSAARAYHLQPPPPPQTECEPGYAECKCQGYAPFEAIGEQATKCTTFYMVGWMDEQFDIPLSLKLPTGHGTVGLQAGSCRVPMATMPWLGALAPVGPVCLCSQVAHATMQPAFIELSTASPHSARRRTDPCTTPAQWAPSSTTSPGGAPTGA